MKARKLLSIRTAALALAVVALAGCRGAWAERGEVPPAPDYARPDAWAAWPGRPSAADEFPDGVPPGPVGDVDVFFIHPTTDLAMTVGNAPYDAGGGIGTRVDQVVLKFQASIFNSAGQLYAPRYRQASLKAITTNTQDAYAADDLAYSDIARAFDVFLAQTHGRRFIIAGHSQGSVHALRLLQDRIIGTPLQHRLVAAYIPGVALPVEIERLGLPVCRSPAQTGCVASWNTVHAGYRDQRRLNDAVVWWKGRYEPIAGRPIVCVNPLDWRVDSTAPASANLGAVGGSGRFGPLAAPIPGAASAACEGGLLGAEIAPDARPHFRDIMSAFGVYHDFDFNLFYMNVRANVAERARR